jgi:hypothetical protein
MRTRRVVRPRRRLLAAAAVPGVFLIIAAAVAGCSGSSSSSSAASSSEASATAPAGAPAAAPAQTAAGRSPVFNGSASLGSSSSGSGTTTEKLTRTGQQLIYTAELTVRAPDVQAAVARATSVVSAAGGYVSGEQANTAPGHPSQSTATVTLKIPAAAYPATLAALSGTSLGTQLALSQQAQDVTQQVADVSSRVTSDQQAIAQLRTLLKHAGSVSSLLSVQNQINSEESDLESMLAQQSSLDHETSYATVTLSLIGPKAAAAKVKSNPPPGLAGGLDRGWHGFRLTVSWLLTVLGAIAPFAAVIIVIGALGWWARRWVTRRRATPAA